MPDRDDEPAPRDGLGRTSVGAKNALVGSTAAAAIEQLANASGTRKLLEQVGQSMRVTQEAAKSVHDMTATLKIAGPAMDQISKLQEMAAATRVANDALTMTLRRRTQAEQATIDTAATVSLLIDVEEVQAREMASMGRLLALILEDQRLAAKSNRRWRWVATVATIVGTIAAVVAAVSALA
jgi:hypothetical protein